MTRAQALCMGLGEGWVHCPGYWLRALWVYVTMRNVLVFFIWASQTRLSGLEYGCSGGACLCVWGGGVDHEQGAAVAFITVLPAAGAGG
jgi:hypothetical protein